MLTKLESAIRDLEIAKKHLIQHKNIQDAVYEREMQLLDIYQAKFLMIKKEEAAQTGEVPAPNE